jgi:hypothetical protein
VSVPTELPPVTPDYIDGLFTEMEAMNVDLDDDPLEYGPRRLSAKVAEARLYLSRCERMSLQVGRLLQQYKRAHRALQMDFDLQLQHMLANDPEVRAGRNVADRNAIATVKLSDLKEQISACEIVIQDLEVINTSIKSKRSDLKDTQSRFRDQMRLCQEEVGLGGRWGDRKATGALDSVLRSAPLIDPTAMAELEALNPKGQEIQIDPAMIVPPEAHAFDTAVEEAFSSSLIAGDGDEIEDTFDIESADYPRDEIETPLDPITTPPVKSFDDYDAVLEEIPVEIKVASPVREVIDIDALLAGLD